MKSQISPKSPSRASILLLDQNIESEGAMEKEFEFFSPLQLCNQKILKDSTHKYQGNIKELPKQQKLNIGLQQVEELGHTIKTSLNQIHQKISETKSTIGNLMKNGNPMDNLWDQKLNDICEQFFNQAKESLFNKGEKPTMFQSFQNQAKNPLMSVQKFSTSKIQQIPSRNFSSSVSKIAIPKQRSPLDFSTLQKFSVSKLPMASPRNSLNFTSVSKLQVPVTKKSLYKIPSSKQSSVSKIQSTKKEDETKKNFFGLLQQSKAIKKIDQIGKNNNIYTQRR